MGLWSYVSCIYIQVMQESGGMCYTPKCDTVEDGLMERASEGNPGGGLRKQVQIEMESKSKGGSRP
jgi:hypothetical protein